MASSTPHRPSTELCGMRPPCTPEAIRLPHSHCQRLGACGSTSWRRMRVYRRWVCTLAASGSSQAAVTEASSTKEVMPGSGLDRKSTRLNSSHGYISYAVFCLKKKKKKDKTNKL